MKEKNGLYFLGVAALGLGSLLALVGLIGIIKGSATRSLGGPYATCMAMGGVIFVMGLAFLGKGHVEAVLRFCNHCGEVVPDTATDCPACGHRLPPLMPPAHPPAG